MRKLFLVFWLLFLPGCGLIVYPAQKMRQLLPSSATRVSLSDPVWSKDSKSIYLVQKEDPLKFTVFDANYLPFIPLPTGYKVDESRKIRYQLIKLELINGAGAKPFILTAWYSPVKPEGYMYCCFSPNFIFSPEENKFIFTEYLHENKSKRTYKISNTDFAVERNESNDLSNKVERKVWEIRGIGLAETIADALFFPQNGRYLDYKISKYENPEFRIFNSSRELINIVDGHCQINGQKQWIKRPDYQDGIAFSPDNSKIVLVSTASVSLIDLDRNKAYQIYSKDKE